MPILGKRSNTQRWRFTKSSPKSSDILAKISSSTFPRALVATANPFALCVGLLGTRQSSHEYELTSKKRRLTTILQTRDKYLPMSSRNMQVSRNSFLLLSISTCRRTHRRATCSLKNPEWSPPLGSRNSASSHLSSVPPTTYTPIVKTIPLVVTIHKSTPHPLQPQVLQIGMSRTTKMTRLQFI